MSTITRERVAGIANGEKCYTHDDVVELSRIALASLEAEAVALRDERSGSGGISKKPGFNDLPHGTPLYAAPPALVSVPDDNAITQHFDTIALEVAREIMCDVHRLHEFLGGEVQLLSRIQCRIDDACRAAMLQGADGKSPVITDDVRRMNWLVSKTVDVREPMVYGSHSLFWSQTITDEEDEYHATKLREQIDAAMEAEQAAAPQQEAKNV